MADNEISKEILNNVIEVTGRNAQQLERIASALQALAEEQKNIRGFLSENRIYYPEKITTHCVKQWENQEAHCVKQTTHCAVVLGDLKATQSKMVDDVRYIKYFLIAILANLVIGILGLLRSLLSD